MPRISKLTAQKNGKRVNIFLDGDYATSLDLATVTRLSLKRGMEITRQDLERLLRQHHFEKLLTQAGRFLSYRPRSEKEIHLFLRGKLRVETEKREHAQLVEDVLAHLRKEKLIDDLAFARWWVEQRLAFRPKGTLALHRELKEKGINRETIEEALVEFNEAQAATGLMERLRRRIKERDPRKAREKLIAHLKRRGFRWETIERVIDERQMNK